MSEMLRRLISEDIDLQIELNEAPICFKADATHMQQVLMNLAVNARDAMPGGGRLLIQTASLNLTSEEAVKLEAIGAGNYAVLTVADSGSGIDPAIRPRIFEPFFTTKEIGKGTGLGLSTVFGIVKQNNGSIQVESEPGRGTTFRIYMPRVQNDIAAGAPTLKEAQHPTLATLLLVEDELPLRDAVAEYLRKRGYTVLTASDGAEAVTICGDTSATIDLLVTDVVMPGMSGPELAQQLYSSRPNLHVVYISGYAAGSLMHEKIGAFLQKPFSFQLLSNRIEELLADDGARAQSC
jgi:CheY-like chemotaxis protein